MGCILYATVQEHRDHVGHLQSPFLTRNLTRYVKQFSAKISDAGISRLYAYPIAPMGWRR